MTDSLRYKTVLWPAWAQIALIVMDVLMIDHTP